MDQTVHITCAAADTLSGIASATCENISRPAYAYSLGTNTIAATATDRAGNVATASTSFTVSVTYDSLGVLTRQFVTKRGVADDLAALLDSAKKSEAQGNPTAKAGKIQAYIHAITAQSGKSLTTDQAAILVRLARAL